METDFSRAALTRFLNYVGDKGLVTPQQAQNWRVATGKITADLSPSEEEDVRKIDVDLAFRRFANKYGSQYTPQTLGEYRKRATSAINSFVAWAADPESFRPKGRDRSKRNENTGRDEPLASKTSRPVQREAETRSRLRTLIPADALDMVYPLRQDFLAQVRIPRDLSLDEAKRMGAFLLSLAHDYRPSTS